jgi:Domain of unknown function (DUF4214)
MKLNRSVSFLLAVLMTPLAACNTVPSPQAQVSVTHVRSLTTPEIVVSSDLKYLKNSVETPEFGIDPAGKYIYFSKTDPEILGVKVGDVLNAGITEKTPYGLLKKVVTIYDYHSTLILFGVEDVAFDEVMSGSLNQEADLDPKKVVESKLAEGVTVDSTAKNYGGSATLPNFKYNFDGVKVKCGDTESTLNGSIDGKFTVYIDTDFEKIGLFRLPRIDKPKLFEAGLKFTGKKQLKLSGKCNLKNVVSTTLVEQSFPGIEYGVPFVFSIGVKPFIKISVGVSGEISVQGTYTLTFDGSSNDGVHWDRDAGWKSIHEETGNDGKEDFKYSAGAKLQTFVELGAGLKFFAQVVSIDFAEANVSVVARPYLELLAQTPPPKLCSYAGLDVALKADASVVSKNIGKWSKNYPVYRRELACVAGTTPPTTTPTTPSIYTQGPCDDIGSAACTFDTRSLSRMSDGTFVESITANGKAWNYDVNGKPWAGNGTDLRNVARFASGPCSLAPAGQPCKFDSRTLVNYPGIGWLESITAYGHFWNFDANGSSVAGNGGDLMSVSRFANGPCMVASGSCTFDTRVLGPLVDGTFIESITAYGRYYNFDVNGNPVGSGDLRSVGRYANGPCSVAPAGQTCKFDSRTYIDYPGAGWVESITAYGHGWNFDANGNPWAGNGFNLEVIERVAPKNTIRQFVGLAFRTLLAREASLSELTANFNSVKWANVTFSQVRDALLNSAEYGQRVSPETYVTNSYQRYFNFAPDPYGLAYWTEQVRNGAALRSGVRDLYLNYVASQNYVSNTALVTAGYRQLFLREPAQSEIDAWVNYLNSGGTSRAGFRDIFINSPEMRTKDLRGLNPQQLQNLFDFSGS